MANEWREVLARRNRTSKTKRLYEDDQPTNKYSWDGMVGTSLHYEETEGDWLEVDPRIVPSSEPGWDWEMQKSHWRFLVRNGGWFAAEKKGVGIGFRLERIAYLNIETKEYQTIRTANYTTPTVTDIAHGNDLLANPLGKLTWANLFPGVDFEIHVSGDRLHEEIKVSQAARDAMPHPPYPVADTYLVMVYEVDWGQVPGLADDEGDIDYDTDFERVVRLYLKNHQGEIITALPASKAWAEGDIENQVPLRKRFVKVGGQHYLLVGAPVLDLNALSEGTIIFDPDIDESIVTGSDDAQEDADDGDMILDDTILPMGNYASLWHGGFRFQTVDIPADSDVTVAYLTFIPRAPDSGSVHYDWYGHKVADAGTFTTDNANISGRARTSAYVEENPPANWDNEVGVNSADIATVVEELVGSGNSWIANNALAILSIYLSGDGERRLSAFEDSGFDAPKLHIEYTAGGPPAIIGTADLTTQPATIAATGIYTPQVITGDSAVATQPAQAAATASQTFAATSSVSSQPAEVAAEAELTFAATSAVTAESAQIAATGTYIPLAITGMSAVTGQPATLVAPGSLMFASTAALTAQPAQIAAEGTYTPLAITGTSAVIAEPASVTAIGGQTFAGTVAVVSQPAQIAAEGEVEIAGFSGTAALVAQPASIAAEGTYTPQAITGTAAVTAQPAIVSAVGEQGFSGEAALTAQAAQVAAQGEVEIEGFTGTAALTAQPAQLVAIGTYTALAIIGTSSIVAQPAVIAAEGKLVFLGSGAVEAQCAVLTGQARLIFAGQSEMVGEVVALHAIGAVSLPPPGIARAVLEHWPDIVAELEHRPDVIADLEHQPDVLVKLETD